MNMSKKLKILITGAAGFVGSHLTRACIMKGYDVSLLLKPSSDTSRIQDILSEVRVVSGDLTDASRLKDIMEEVKPKGIFHLAASTVMSGKTASPDEVIKSNILGTVNLMNAASDARMDFFVNSGTFLEYAPQKRALKESDPSEPSELYSISKLSGTMYGKAVSRSKNLPIITLRVFTPYGPSLQKGRLVYEMIMHALKNKEIALTDPSTTRDFIFVEDLVNCYLAAAEKAKEYPGEIFNAGSGNATTLEELVKLVLSLTDSKSRAVWGKTPSVYDASLWQADMEKTFSSFVWRPEHDLKQGLEKTIEWYRKHESKSEAQNPKSETNPKSKFQMF